MVKCQHCGQEFPMNETFEIDGRILCAICSEPFLSNRKDKQASAIKEQIDPTICLSCGLDNEDVLLPKMAGAPVCVKCESFFRNRPFPQWIKASLVGIIALVICSIAWNMRLFRDILICNAQ